MRKYFAIAVAVVVVSVVASYPPVRAAVAGAVLGTNTHDGSYGVLGSAAGGVYGFSPSNSPGVRGDSTGSNSAGVYGQGFWGVVGATSGVNSTGVTGSAGNQTAQWGVYGSTTGTLANSNVGLYGYAPSAYAVYGSSTAAGWAGYFSGDVRVTGTLYKSAGAFQIDHPLDPVNKYLTHSFVESDQMKNVYDGIATLNERGEAVVQLPSWFEALNKDYRYQLTCIGENAPVFIAKKVEENRFTIAGGFEGMEVSWQVTGVRRDPYALAHPLAVESEKSLDERGKMLHPELYRMPESMTIGRVVRPGVAVR